MGSALAYRAIPLQSAYCGAKHAIRGFSNSLRTELSNEGSRIKVTIVDLPAVNTPQFDWARVHVPHSPRPMGAPVEPEVVADAVFRAAHGPWREYWLGASTLLTILDNTILPGYLDRFMAKKGIKGQQTSTLVGPDVRTISIGLYRPCTVRAKALMGHDRRVSVFPRLNVAALEVVSLRRLGCAFF